MKKRIVEAFQSEQLLKEINLESKKLHALTGFLASLPAIATKAATKQNIMHGFYESGLLDRESGGYPVMKTILATCRSSISKEMYNKTINNFRRLYTTVAQFGRIPEEVFDLLGFPTDVDVKGNIVRRDAGMGQESYQRSKCLTHDHRLSCGLSAQRK